MIEDSTIRQVHDRVDIVDVVSRFNITLTRKGAHYVGLCPFHNEKTGSFIVSPNRNTYHCFGCGAHGDGIDFVMKLDNRTYPEAIEYLANMYGIQVLHSEKPMTDEHGIENRCLLPSLVFRSILSSSLPPTIPNPRRPVSMPMDVGARNTARKSA